MNGLFKNNMSFAVILALGLLASAAPAQQASAPATQQQSAPAAQSQAPVAAAPQTFKARYDGGVFGYNRKIEGNLSFDDSANRLVFRDKKDQVLFVIPYQTLSAAFADVRSRRPKAATVVGSLPVPYGLNFPAMFVRNKYRYLTLQYRDAETDAVGTTSFKLGNKQLLESVLSALARKAELTRRGEIFVRPRKDEGTRTGVYEVATPPQPQ